MDLPKVGAFLRELLVGERNSDPIGKESTKMKRWITAGLSLMPRPMRSSIIQDRTLTIFIIISEYSRQIRYFHGLSSLYR